MLKFLIKPILIFRRRIALQEYFNTLKKRLISAQALYSDTGIEVIVGILTNLDNICHLRG